VHAKRKILIPVLVVVVAAIGTVVWPRLPFAHSAGSGRLGGSGTVEATEVEVGSKIPGRLEEIYVQEGVRVERGQVIARLDARELRAEADRAQGALLSAEARLRDLERGSRAERIDAAAARVRQADATLEGARTQLRIAEDSHRKSTELRQKVDQAAALTAVAEAALVAARAQYEEAINGPRPQEVRQADARLEQTEAALSGASQAEALSQRLAELEESFTAPLVEAQTAQKTAELALSIAQEQESLVDEGARSEQIAQAQAKLRAADVTLANARRRFERIEQLYRSNVVSLQEHDDAQAAFESASAQRTAAAAAVADIESGARPQERRSAVLSSEQAQAALEGARQGVPNAETGLEKAQVAADMNAQIAAAERQGAEAAVEAARAQSELMHEGTRAERIAQAEAAVGQADAGLEGAQATLVHAREAYEDRFLSLQQLEMARTQLDIAQAQREAAMAELALLLEGSTEEVIEMARGDVQQARAAVEQAGIRLAETEIMAPTSGTVSDVVVEEGEIVPAGAAVVTMMDLESMWLKVYVPVTDLHSIEIGDAARVTIDGDAGALIPGEVLVVSQEAEFTPKNVQTVDERVKQVFWVKVGVGDGQGLLRPGMPADASFDPA